MHELSRFMATVEILRRSISKELPSQQIVLYLTVVQEPGITMPELSRRLDMPQGSVSRNIKALSDYTERVNGVLVRKGYGLLMTEPDRFNVHCLAVFPTSRGRELALTLAAELGTEVTQPEGEHGSARSPRCRAEDLSRAERSRASFGPGWGGRLAATLSPPTALADSGQGGKP